MAKAKQTGIDSLLERMKTDPPRRRRRSLSADEVAKAKKARELGATFQAIGDALGVSDYTAWCACNGKRAYAPLNGDPEVKP
jgi:hypothetical protein